MYHKWWDGRAWGGWENLGGVVVTRPTVVSWGANRLDCFAAGTNNTTYHKCWDGTRWDDWESLGLAVKSEITPVSWAANRIDLFVEGADESMYHNWLG